MERYYTSEQMAGFAELRAETPPEDVEAVEREWTALPQAEDFAFIQRAREA